MPGYGPEGEDENETGGGENPNPDDDGNDGTGNGNDGTGNGGDGTGNGGVGDNESDVFDLCNTIEYIVYNANNTETFVKHETYTSDDDDDVDFNVIYDYLPAGTYVVVFIAYQNTSSAVTTLSGNRMSFDDVFDTFHTAFTLNVLPGQEVVQDVSLVRIVGKIDFMATDAVPENAKAFTIQVNRYPRELDVISGKGIIISSSDFSTVHTFTTGEKGMVGMIYPFLTFIPEEDGTMDIQTIATDDTDGILRQRNVLSAVPKSNRTVRYKGILYTLPALQDAFAIQILNEWGPIEEVDLED